jgi:flagellar basal body P-ring protein FlgI
MMEREIKYTVIKNKDIENALDADEIETLETICKKINQHREREGKKAIECVVVEHDWPEYLDVWSMIAMRVDKVTMCQARMQQFKDYEGDKS